MLMVALQDLIAYSVNMADNIMLGSYSQSALSGAATVNQVFFVVSQVASGCAVSLSVLAAQYWGAKNERPIRFFLAKTLRLGLYIGFGLIILCAVIPKPILRIFTTSPEIISEGVKYLDLIKWTFVLYIVSQILMAALRAVGTVRISFYLSIMSLVVNVGINYVLIFGKAGFPEMGIVGAAIGTLVSRILEVIVLVIYILFFEKKMRFFAKDMTRPDKVLAKDYMHVWFNVAVTSLLFALTNPIQTALLGHMSDDAIAANSVAMTFFQYLKVIVNALTTAQGVIIGNTVGRGNVEEVKAEARTLSAIDVTVGAILGIIIVSLRKPLLSLYRLTDTAKEMSGAFMILMAIIMVCMSYQKPLGYGIMRAAGDTKFGSRLTFIYTLCIALPLSFAAALWWKLPPIFVILAVQSDQITKCFPVFFRFRKYQWIKKLTRDDV